jgi:putative ABC transport system permease protein
VTLDPKAAGYDDRRLEGFWRQTLDRVGAIPGVHSASLARIVPLAPGRQRQPWRNATTGEQIELDTHVVGPRYFRTLDIPLVGGREFDERDGRTSPPIIIVNERLARMFWPGLDPIGKGVRLPDAGNATAEVVGLVKDVKYQDLRGETGPVIYRPMFQSRSTDAMTLHVRAATDHGAVAGAIRAEVKDLDPSVPIVQINALEDLLNASFAQTRQAAVLTGVFGVVALLLSAIGVYGVTALAVARRTHDIGVRMALGAQPRDIVRLIGRRGLTVVGTGLVLGLAGSLAFTQIATRLLFGVSAADSATFAGTAALLAVISVVAFSIPMRAATRLDAVTAIRCD